MAEEKHDEGDWEFPLRKPFDLRSQPADSHAETHHDVRQKHSLTHSSATRHVDVATELGPAVFPTLGTKPPGIFIDLYNPELSLTTGIKEIPINDESYIEQFHDSESEDIFTLYNAVNGEVHDGFLDIRKLKDLSKEELEILNLNRLQEIWLHTLSGCATCAGIVRTLNSVRGMMCDEEFVDIRDAARSDNGKPN